MTFSDSTVISDFSFDKEFRRSIIIIACSGYNERVCYFPDVCRLRHRIHFEYKAHVLYDNERFICIVSPIS